MQKLFTLLLALAVVTTVFAQTPPNKKSYALAATKAKTVAASVYQCPDCHKKFTAAQAKTEGMKCSCCQTKLIAIKSATVKLKKATVKKS